MSFTRSKDPSRCWVERLQFEAPSKGKWTYQCLGMSDDYVGLDVLADVSITGQKTKQSDLQKLYL